MDGSRTEEDWRKLQSLIAFHKSDEPPDISQRETLYKCPPKKQTLVKLLLINQESIGFYIVRLKGLQEDGGPPFEMPILDGVFISKAYRKQGWGTAMIDDLVNVHFPGQDVGFSQPISVSLESVLKKFLTANPQHRSKLWAVENCGEEGDRLNLWLSLAIKR
ncbi:protein FAM169B-like isoform X2 [Daphnia pulicaria]|uniref:protein FAM169B-like isoform X2 n=1 Tax=Daphnia pulicaria TaxID=35523 RepID=UPI001EECA2E9|nr:protein FAM169B-like isoform X2 [Daphnia pulicaria]